MSRKISRNDSCPCGSGKKYKYCCLDEEAAVVRKMSLYLEDYVINEKKARIKQCIHPNKSECKGDIIKAHAIQNNRILTKLAVDGMLINLDGVSNFMFQDAQLKGRKITTTFTGFCSSHDKTLFQDIEDKEFLSTKKQIFLYTYRTFAWHYHKKIEQVNKAKLRTVLAYKHQLPGIFKNNDSLAQFDSEIYGCLENVMRLEEFNKCLTEDNFEEISSCIWEIPYEVQIAVSAMLEIEHDINGVQINNIRSPKPLKSIYLNIFPGNGVSYCLWSWMKQDKIYNNFTRQFLELSIEDRKNYFNKYLPRWTDAIVISPRLWNKWGNEVQQALLTHANFEVLYRQMESEDNNFVYKYMETPWDFFEQIFPEDT